MGEVISKKASAEDILADVRLTLTRGQTRGGDVAQIVERRLAPVVDAIATVEGERRSLATTLLASKAERDAANDAARLAVNATYDALWNEVGRPAQDTTLSILFPGGAGAYLDGPTDELGPRIGLLDDVLGRDLHPRIAAESITAARARLAAVKDACVAACSAHRDVSLRAEHVEKVYFTLVRSAQTALAAVKRDLKSEGYTEAAAHEIIPDHPRSRGAVAPTTPRPNGTPASQPS